MEMFLTITLISLFVVAGFAVYATAMIGHIPTCISETYYLLPRNRWLFQAAMIVGGMLALPAWLEVSPERWQFLAFLGCAGLIFVGASPAFLDHFEGKVHYTATVIAAVSAVAWLIVGSQWGWVALLFFTACAVPFINRMQENWLLIVECVVLASAYSGIIIGLI